MAVPCKQRQREKRRIVCTFPEVMAVAVVFVCIALILRAKQFIQYFCYILYIVCETEARNWRQLLWRGANHNSRTNAATILYNCNDSATSAQCGSHRT